MCPRELDREFRVIAGAREDQWVRSRAQAFWIAQLGRVKNMPKFEHWIKPPEGRRVAGGGRPVQGLDSMKAAIYQMAAKTGTTVTRGGETLIGARGA